MADRTAFQFRLHACPPEEVADFFALIDDLGLSTDPGPWSTTPSTAITLGETYSNYETRCGSVDEWANEVAQAAPNACWEMWEDPKYEWLGDYACFTPGLGLYRAQCDADGVPQFSAEQIRTALADTDPDALERLLGGPWDDEIATHARPHDAAPVVVNRPTEEDSDADQ